MDEKEKEYGLYCDKCGNTYDCLATFDTCQVCGNKLKIVPDEYFITEDEKEFCELSEEMKQKLIEKLVFTSPNFNQYYFDHRDEIMTKIYQEVNQEIDENIADLARIRAKNAGTNKGNPYGITCPYCKATNIRKIGLISRSVSAGLFGLGSKKIGKQWHCDHCGSDF